MDGLIILGLVVWLVSTLSKAAKRQQQRAAQPGTPQGRGTRVPRPPAPGEEPASYQPIRPVEVDLPARQATMPIHRDEPSGEGVSMWDRQSGLSEGMSDARLAKDRIRPSEQANAEQAAKNEAAASSPNPVAIAGLDLRLNADTLVKGVIFSEILNRRTNRRT